MIEVNTYGTKLVKSTPHNNLSRLQRWICKLFKIVPERRYSFTVELLIDWPFHRVGRFDGFLADDVSKWIVTDKKERSEDDGGYGTLTVMNRDPLLAVPSFSKIVVFESSYAEGNKWETNVLQKKA